MNSNENHVTEIVTEIMGKIKNINLESNRYNQDRRNSRNYRRNSNYSWRKIQYTPEEEKELNKELIDSYGKNLNDLLTECFSKRFVFDVNVRLNSKVMQTNQSQLFCVDKWSDDLLLELQIIKRKLNAVKDKLDEFPLNDWHQHTRSTNPADLVIRRLRREIKVEFVTQAWCKFYEVLWYYKLIPNSAVEKNVFYSLHLCEAPGAFVASLNHYLKLNYPNLEWYWIANSLNPYYEGNHLSEMINDDRFMLETIDKWDFGPDMTGDITQPFYPIYFSDKCGVEQPHLITADGSFDCQDRPAEQESSVSWLHLKEVLVALNVLRKGGSFVIKMFTFFECDTVCLLYLLGSSFESVNVIKPFTSKEGNSEVYVVCKKFKGRESIKPLLEKLLKIKMEEYQKYSMFPYELIPRTFKRQVVECASKFAELQTSVIERNIRLFPYKDSRTLHKHFKYVQDKFSEEFISRYHIRALQEEDLIMSYSTRNEVRIPKVIESRLSKEGSHNDQVKRLTLSSDKLYGRVSEELNKIMLNGNTFTIEKEDDIPFEVFEIHFGKAIETVFSSQFCYGSLIRLRNELMSAIGVEKYNIAGANIKPCLQVADSMNIIRDFSNTFMPRNYNSAQLESFRMIYDAILELKNEHSNLILYAYPLLTQFNVNIVFLLRQFFKEIVFEAPNTLYFNDVDLIKRNMWMVKITEIFKFYTPVCAVISFLPLSYITGPKNQFYSWVVDVNNHYILHEIQQVIDFSPR